MESRFIHRAGVPLHGLWQAGDGDPLVVVPGVMADAEAFVLVVEAIERPEPVLILDRRGRSPSGPLGTGYSVQTEVSDLCAWIDHLATPVTLIGWSYGATIALEAAALDERVATVIGYEPVLGPFGEHALPALREADLDRRVEIVNLEVSLFPRERVDALRSSAAWPVLCRLAAPLAEELAALNRFQPDRRWADVPAKLILGEQSRHTEPYGSAFDRVVARLPRSQTTVLAGQGHLAHANDPVALGREIASLIGRPDQPGRVRGASYGRRIRR